MAPYRYDDNRRQKKKRERKIHGIKGNKELKRMGKTENEKEWMEKNEISMTCLACRPTNKLTPLGLLTIPSTATSHHNIDCSQ